MFGEINHPVNVIGMPTEEDLRQFQFLKAKTLSEQLKENVARGIHSSTGVVADDK